MTTLMLLYFIIISFFITSKDIKKEGFIKNFSDFYMYTYFQCFDILSTMFTRMQRDGKINTLKNFERLFIKMETLVLYISQ